MNLKGHLDTCDINGINGWIVNTHQPESPVEIEIYIDAECITRLVAHDFRKDLLGANIANGQCAFNFPMPRQFFDAQEHTLMIKEVTTQWLLPNSEKVFTLPTVVERKLKGHVEICTISGINGWVIDELNPQEAIEISLFIDGEFIAQTFANKFRKDLQDAKIGDGHHAFSLAMPKHFFDDVDHIIEVYEVSKHWQLPNAHSVFNFKRSLTTLESGSIQKQNTVYDLVRTYVLQNDFENARIYSDELIKDYPNFYPGYELAEDIYIRLGLFETANKIFLSRPVTKKATTIPKLPPNYPPELILPPIIGNGNDYSFIEEKVKQFIASGKPYKLPVSIIIPVYNRKQLLAKVLASLTHQTYPMNLMEIVVVDDGSYEKVETVIRKYESYLPLKYLRQADRGYRLAEARNFGMRTARHDFFIILNGDVIASPQLVEAYMQFFHVYERIVMTGQVRFICSDSISDDNILEDINTCLNLPDISNENTLIATKLANGDTVDCRLPSYIKNNFLKNERFPFFCINGWTYAHSRKALQIGGNNDEAFQSWGFEEVEQAYRFYNAGYYCIPVINALGLHQEPPVGQQVSRAEGKVVTSVLFEEKCPVRNYQPNRIYQVPKVSIYIPAYNAEKYIKSAIDSALKQTYTDFEIVIVNDGSTDNTLKIIEENYADNRRVRWFTQSNQGTAKTSNTAVSLCRGMYIGQLDADDLLKPNALEMTVSILDQHNVGYVCSQYDIIDEQNNYIREGWSLPFSREWLIVSNIAGSFRLFRKRDFIRCGGFDESLETAEDYDLALRMAETCDIYFLPEVLYSYRWHGQNTSTVKREQQEIDHVNCINKALQRMSLAKQWNVVPGDVNKRDVKFINRDEE